MLDTSVVTVFAIMQPRYTYMYVCVSYILIHHIHLHTHVYNLYLLLEQASGIYSVFKCSAVPSRLAMHIDECDSLLLAPASDA